MSREIKLKIIIVGNSAVGKSSILKSFISKRFDDRIASTLGFDFMSARMRLGEDDINLALWDTAGSEKYNAVTPNFYRSTHGAILVFDVTKRKTLEDLRVWKRELLQYADPSIPCLVLGNKIDCENERTVTTEEGENFAHTHRMMYMECSAKTLEGVDYAFEELVHKIRDTPGLWQYELASTSLTGEPQASGCRYKCYRTAQDVGEWSGLYVNRD